MKQLNANLRELVQILNDGQFHSGQELGERLNMSRVGVWKHLEQLQKFGITITAVHGTGYQLTHPLYLLDGAQIRQHTQTAGTDLSHIPLDIFAQIGSTNDYLKQTSEPVQLCIAEQQTQGRGRFKRHWHSPFAQNIYASLAWTLHTDISQLSGLPAVVALATVKALNASGFAEDIRIKWPNDIYYRDQKLAGILIDTTAESNQCCRVVIGVGLNVNLEQTWASLRQINGRIHDRNLILGHLIHHLFNYLNDFNHYGFTHFLPQWREFDYLYGKDICLNHLGHTIEGIAQGIDQQGALIIKQGQNSRHISAGDATLQRSTA